MKPVVSDWTIAIVGSWNLAILSPDWLARHVLHVEKIDVQVTIGGATPTLRFLSGSLSIIPRPDRIVIGAGGASREAIIKAGETAVNLMTELPKTPITAIGVNLGYLEEEPNEDLTGIFNLADNADLAALDLTVRKTDILRSLAFDPWTLNFRISLADNGSMRSHFNFHKQVANSDQAIECLREQTAQLKEKAEGILAAAYNLKMEDQNA